MADKPEPTLPPAAQAAAVREMLKDKSMTLEGIETKHPELADGVKIVLETMRKPRKATSGSAPLTPKLLADAI